MPPVNGSSATAAREFASLATVLCCIADDAIACLKSLKKRLAHCDSRHGRRFVHTAVAYLRTDLRAAKDAASALPHVAHQLVTRWERSESATDAARDVMGRLAKAMDRLQTTAHQYDEEVVLRRQSQQRKADGQHSTGCARAPAGRAGRGTGHVGAQATDTVEQLVKTIVRDNFNISALSHQITIANKSLSCSTSSVERVKLLVQDVEEKLDGDRPRAKLKGHARRT
ncbi:unnamed protein product [Hyaloperonospora brassicae]|uniref:Uncharacterized protein n=1 Tax=Hyaloperonospora brassicae TaxID=162125 RepID=A0AAV0T4P3_HYABA|nr:unnamed protein product [Hyaloperonospora brassicae]